MVRTQGGAGTCIPRPALLSGPYQASSRLWALANSCSHWGHPSGHFERQMDSELEEVTEDTDEEAGPEHIVLHAQGH